MQEIAAENNLAETAFFVPEGAGYRIRWFTPLCEVPLCGHATLASAWVIFHHLAPISTAVQFQSLSGPLGVHRLDDGWLELDFPSLPCSPVAMPQELATALGVETRGLAVKGCYMVTGDSNTLVELENIAAVKALDPDFRALKALRHLGLGIIVTARGDDCDFVSRYFAPAGGIDEDPVTGSTHSVLTPFWAARLGRSTLTARQISRRGGELRCTHRGERVGIAGQAAGYLEAVITLPDEKVV